MTQDQFMQKWDKSSSSVRYLPS